MPESTDEAKTSARAELLARADARVEAGLRRVNLYSADEKLIYDLARALEGSTPHALAASDGAVYLCSCPLLVDHPVLAVTPEEWAAQHSVRAENELLRARIDMALACYGPDPSVGLGRSRWRSADEFLVAVRAALTAEVTG